MLDVKYLASRPGFILEILTQSGNKIKGIYLVEFVEQSKTVVNVGRT